MEIVADPATGKPIATMQAFQAWFADHRDLGGKEFTDVLDGIDHMAEKGWVDLERVGITGGSYGGYFTALGVTRSTDELSTRSSRELDCLLAIAFAPLSHFARLS